MENDELDKDMVKDLVLSEVMYYKAKHAASVSGVSKSGVFGK